MTSMEIRSLLEESEPPESEEGGGDRHRSRQLLLVALALVVLVVGLVGYFVLASHPAPVSATTTTSATGTKVASSTPGQASAPIESRSSTGVPVPASQYFSVKNPFVPKISQSGSSSSVATTNG
jgi:flagellar basal body-associated protein FliL